MQPRYYATGCARRRSCAVIDVLRTEHEEEPGPRERGLAVGAKHRSESHTSASIDSALPLGVLRGPAEPGLASSRFTGT
jgi:hypothetical protein